MWQNNYFNPENMGQFIWVNSDEEAENMPVMPGTDVIMINRNGQMLYQKSNKNFGETLFIRYNIERIEEPEPEEPVSRQEFNKILAMMQQLIAQQNGGNSNDAEK